MCRAATCRVCGKTSWAGCGRHVDQVMRAVPKTERCTCGPNHQASAGSGDGKGLLSRLFGR